MTYTSRGMVMCIAFIVVAFFLPVVTSEGAARSNPGHRLCLDCFTSFAGDGENTMHKNIPREV